MTTSPDPKRARARIGRGTLAVPIMPEALPPGMPVIRPARSGSVIREVLI